MRERRGGRGYVPILKVCLSVNVCDGRKRRDPALASNPWPEQRVEQRFLDRTFLLRISIGHTNGSLVGDNYFYSVKTGALGAKRSAIVRS